MEEKPNTPTHLIFSLPSGRVSHDKTIAPGAFDDCTLVSIPIDQLRLESSFRIIKSHVEGETLVIDVAELVEVSVCMASAEPKTF